MWQWFAQSLTFGNVLEMSTIIVAAILGWNNLNWRVKIIEDWKEAHHHTLQQQLDNVTLLRENSAKLTALVEGQSRRLQLLEEAWTLNQWKGRPHLD